MADLVRLDAGDVRLTRVPYFDVPLDPSAVDLDAAQVASAPWAVPTWATAGGQVLVGQAVWVLEAAGTVIVVDPCCAADAFLRTGPAALGHQDAVMAALSSAGVGPDRVDAVVLSHLDGIGMAALVDGDGDWRPAFPRARIVLTAAELAAVEGLDAVAGLDVLRRLIDQHAVDGVPPVHELAPGVVMRQVGGHTPGHAVVEVESGGRRAVLLGHLALSPVHLTAGVGPGHDRPAVAQAVLDVLVAGAATDGAWLAGPLWPFPGAVTVPQAGGEPAAVPVP